MSQLQTRITARDVVQFVEQNTTETATWITREEILWVLSWYGDAETGHVRTALERAVSNGDLVAEHNRYAVPTHVT